ncbi:transferrin-binding protein-like solute binding protein [Pasteurella sp. PK-2025]|uniref:transferrin-binding protein-like solute binding protein n=1 Tax=unclassified Pasteurella TaxID=2621516 RepID=UPI003C762E4D
MSNKFKYTSLALLSTLLVACSGGGSTPADNGQKNEINPQNDDVPSPVFHLSAQPTYFIQGSQNKNNEPINPQEIEKIEKLLVGENKLLLLSAGETQDTESITGKATDDVGLHLVKNKVSDVLEGLGKIKTFTDFKNGSNTLLVLRDPQTNGWKHHSFGRYTIPNTGKTGYFSFGEQSQNLPASGTITYKGIVWGDAGEKQGDSLRPVNSVSGELAATFELKANFDNKTLEFKTTNTKGYSLQEQKAVDYSKFDLTGTAKWDNGQKSFIGTVNTKDNINENGTLKGSFYGPNAIEVGGTFGIQTNDKFYQGGFGGKQVKDTEKADTSRPASR